MSGAFIVAKFVSVLITAEKLLASIIDVVLKSKFPLESILIRSVGLAAPSAVVENTSLDGFDDALHVPPSRLAKIVALVPWAESPKATTPRSSPFAGEEAVEVILITPAAPPPLLPWARIVVLLEVEDVPTNTLPELSSTMLLLALLGFLRLVVESVLIGSLVKDVDRPAVERVGAVCRGNTNAI